MDPRLLRENWSAAACASPISCRAAPAPKPSTPKSSPRCARSGCRNLTYAPESGSPRMLADIKKKAHPERVLALDAHRQGIGSQHQGQSHDRLSRRDAPRSVRDDSASACARPGSVSTISHCSRSRRIPAPSSTKSCGATAPCRHPTTTTWRGSATWTSRGRPRCRRNIGTVELNLYRILGMSAFYAIGYLRHPQRMLRTVRNVMGERSDTVLEQRLVEFKRILPWRRAAAPAARGELSADQPRREKPLISIG